MLDRTRTQERKFRRLAAPVLVDILGDATATPEPAAADEAEPGPAEETTDPAPDDEPPVAP